MENDEIIDLSKTIELSKEEELKLASYLSKLQMAIKDDHELMALLDTTINKWAAELPSEPKPTLDPNPKV